jgi:endonuclease YncB( thermonuclease family)
MSFKIWKDEECAPFVTGFRPAEIIKWYDADTPTLRINVGFDINGIVCPVRLLSEKAVTTPDKSDDVFDAWEMRGSERELGKAAKARALDLAPVGSEVRIWSFKGSGSKGKYGRWLVVILAKAPPEVSEDGDWISIADILLEEGHGEDKL